MESMFNMDGVWNFQNIDFRTVGLTLAMLS